MTCQVWVYRFCGGERRGERRRERERKRKRTAEEVEAAVAQGTDKLVNSRACGVDLTAR